jgi:hypothetical protein
MYKSATKCNETIGKWCKNKHGASKIIDTFEMYHSSLKLKTKSLADEVSKLKVESSAAQELANKQHANAESTEKGLQQRLLAALDSLRGEYYPLSDTSFSLGASFC